MKIKESKSVACTPTTCPTPQHGAAHHPIQPAKPRGGADRGKGY